MKLPDIKWIELSTGQTSYFDTGDVSSRPAVVLLHGGGLDCASLSWREAFPELSDNFRVIAPNWPGYGGSSPFGGNYRIEDLGRWLTEFLDRLGIGPAAFVGISMGGGAAIWMAIHEPARVSKLVPVGTFGIAKYAPFHKLSWIITQLPLNAWSYAWMRRNPKVLEAALRQIFLDPKKLSAELSTEVLDVLRNGANGTAFSHFQRGEMGWTQLRSVFTDQLHLIRCPTLFVHGEGDKLVPVDDVRKASANVSGAKVEIMKAGHWPMSECPTAINALIDRFLLGSV